MEWVEGLGYCVLI